VLFDELRRLGFIEGQNLTIDWRGYGLGPEQVPGVAIELVKSKVDVIFCTGDIAVRAVQHATTTIPILAVTDDMLGSGLVRSLARPGGNTTGLTILASELDGKRQEILIEAAPRARRIAVLADTNVTKPLRLRGLEDAARARGVELSVHRIAKSEEVVPTIDEIKASDAAGLNVLASPLLFANRHVIINRAASLRIPAIYQWPETAEEGGLIGYGPRIIQLWRDVISRQLAELLRGTKPQELPIQQPTKFELVINLRAATLIGHDVPAGLALRADKVIE
jgi:putative ABC transport system substrate-binding protein